MKKINLTAIQKQLAELGGLLDVRDFIPSVFVTCNSDGSLTIDNPKIPRAFETMFEVETEFLKMPGITKETVCFVEDFATVPDGRYLPGGKFENGPYVPADPLWYYCGTEQRKQFIQLAHAGDDAAWMKLYLETIERILSLSAANPDTYLPAFDDPALKDLIENRREFTPEQLVERYRDRKWFTGTKH